MGLQPSTEVDQWGFPIPQGADLFQQMMRQQVARPQQLKDEAGRAAAASAAASASRPGKPGAGSGKIPLKQVLAEKGVAKKDVTGRSESAAKAKPKARPQQAPVENDWTDLPLSGYRGDWTRDPSTGRSAIADQQQSASISQRAAEHARRHAGYLPDNFPKESRDAHEEHLRRTMEHVMRGMPRDKAERQAAWDMRNERWAAQQAAVTPADVAREREAAVGSNRDAEAQNLADDERMARKWRDYQTRGLGVDAADEREATMGSNAGALSAMEARRAAGNARLDQQVADSARWDRERRAKEEAAEAADRAARGDEAVDADIATAKALRAQKRAAYQAKIAHRDLVRRWGAAALRDAGYGPDKLLSAQMVDATRKPGDPKNGAAMLASANADMHAFAEGNARQQLAAHNAQKAQLQRMREGLGPVIRQDTLIAAGNDPVRQAAAFAAMDPVLAQNLLANHMVAQGMQPPAQPGPIDQAKQHLDFVNWANTQVPPEMRHSVFTDYLVRNNGMDPKQAADAAGKLVVQGGSPAPTIWENLGGAVGSIPGLIGQGVGAFTDWLYGNPPAWDGTGKAPGTAPTNSGASMPRAAARATNYMDPQSVAMGMGQRPVRVLGGLGARV